MKKPIIAALAIFTAEVLAIVGYYWLACGYAGNVSLTISRYVGLNTWSSILFLIGNLAIIALSAIYMVNSGARKFSWRFLVSAYMISFLALSICPHIPNGDQIIYIHRFFAAAMFISLCLLSLATIDVAKNKLARIFCLSYALYGFHFIIAYANHLPYLMNSILIWEAAFVYGSFIVLLLGGSKNKERE